MSHVAHASANDRSRAPAPGFPRAQPFRGVEEAWFWTMAALRARRENSTCGSLIGKVVRPCDPDDIVKCLDRLYREGRLSLAHARILRVWGERQVAPSERYFLERTDSRLWREALGRLEWPLRVKGIIA